MLRFKFNVESFSYSSKVTVSPSSHLQSALASWITAPAPSQGAGTRPYSVSEPFRAQDSPPAAPPCAYALSRAPAHRREMEGCALSNPFSPFSASRVASYFVDTPVTDCSDDTINHQQ